MRRAFKAAALVALLAAAAAAAPERDTRASESHSFDHKTTAKKKYDLRVTEGGGRVRLRVKASVRAGEFRIVVRDAAGRLWQDARLGPSKRPTTYDVDTGEVESPAGVWTVEVEAKEAVGSYEVTFTQDGK